MRTIRILSLILGLIFCQNYLSAQKAQVTTIITGTHSNNISDYIYSGKLSVTYNKNGYCCWQNQYATAVVTNTTTGAVLKTKLSNWVYLNNLNQTNHIQMLNTSDLLSLLSPGNFDITGMSYAELVNFNSHGILPDGNYDFCFEYWTSNLSDPYTNQTDITSNYCAYNINISASAQLANVTAIMSWPTLENNFNWFKNAANLTLTTTSAIQTYYNTSIYIKLTGDNGVVITTKLQKCSTLNLFQVSPTMPHIASTSDLQSWFNEADLDIVGLGPDFTNFGILPNGNYQLCFIAHHNINCADEISDANLACINFTVQSDPVRFTLSTTNITSNKISDIKNTQLSILVQSQSKYQTAKIGIQIIGGNGVLIESSKLGQLPIYSVNPNIPISLTMADLNLLFDVNNLVVKSGLSPAKFLVDGELPDGTFEICYQAFDNNNQLISENGFTNCIIPFTLGSGAVGGGGGGIGDGGGVTSLFEAPILIMPMCGDSAAITFPQNIIFSWLPPSSFNIQQLSQPQEYYLRIVEMNEFIDAWDAVRKATTPYFFEKVVTGINYIYGPADPILEKGKKYAYYVQINNNRAAYRNNGQSDVCWFSWGGTESKDTVLKILPTIRKKDFKPLQKIEIINPICGSNPVDGNQLYIKWKDDNKSRSTRKTIGLNTNQQYLFEIREFKPQVSYSNSKIVYTAYSQNLFMQIPVALLKLTNKTVYHYKVYLVEGINNIAESDSCKFTYNFYPPITIPHKNSLTVNGQIIYNAKGKEGDFVLNNTGFTIKEYFYVANKSNVNQPIYIFSQNPFKNDPLKEFNLMTNDDGYFKQKIDLDSIGVLNEDFSQTSSKGYNVKGVLVHGIEIIINNNYYKPLESIYSVSLNKTMDLGKIRTNVYTFDLSVTVMKGYKDVNGLQENCENCQVNLYKQSTAPAGLPSFKLEGGSIQLNASNPEYTYESSEKTVIVNDYFQGKITKVEFKNLLCTKNQNHHWLVTTKDQKFGEGSIVKCSNTKKAISLVYISKSLPRSKVKGQIFYAYKGTNTALPLRASLLLKVCYVAIIGGEKVVMNEFNARKKNTGTSDMAMALLLSFNKKYPDNEKTIGYTNSSSSGEFEFNVENPNEYTNEEKQFNITSGNGEFKGVLNGQIYRCLRIVVNNGYYTNPDDDIFIDPLETVNVGKVTALVRAMKIKVICKSTKFENQAVVSGGAVSGLEVTLLRKGPIANYFPANEGNIYKQNNVPDAYKDNKKNISYGLSDKEGIIEFNDVVINSGKEFEKITVFAKSPDLKGDYNYIGAKQIEISLFDLQNKNPNFHSDAKYNSDYSIPTLIVNMNMVPMQPKVKGRVLDIAKASTGLSNASASLVYEHILTMFGKKIPNTEILKTITDKDGYFEFSNIKDYKAESSPLVSQSLKLKISKTGYVYKGGYFSTKEYVTELGLLKVGEQRILPEIYLTPAATLTGIVKDENGNPVDCYVAAVGSDLKESQYTLKDYVGFVSSYKINIAPGIFRRIVVWPKDLKYFIDTITIPSIVAGKNTFDITVSKRLHRFKFYVTSTKFIKSGMIFKEKQTPLANANIEIEGNFVKTDDKGMATLVFANTSTKNFTAKISGPNGESYIQENIKLTNYESKDFEKTINIKLFDGGSLNGVVYLEGKPLKGAKVFVEMGSSQKPIEVITDEYGNYSLLGLTLNADHSVLVSVTATDINPAIIGTQQKINLALSKSQNFNLNIFNDFDISQFYGFNLDITGITKLNSDEVVVKGYVKINKENSDFALGETGKISFKELKFKKGNSKNAAGKFIGIPESNELITDLLGINLTYGQHINVYFSSKEWYYGKPLKIIKSGNNAIISGFASIVDNSFDFPGSYLSFGKTNFYFGEKNKSGYDKVIIDAFYAVNSSKKIYNICNYKGEAIKYKFLQFNAESNPTTSTISLKSENEAILRMDTKIAAHFDNITPSDFDIDLGIFEMNHEKIFPLTGKQNIKFKLEKWTVEVKNWQITTDKGGITSNEGFITAGVINIPFTYFHMQNNLLKFDQFQLKELNLGNVTKLEIGEGTTSIFGFDQATGTDKKPHWKMSLVGDAIHPAASFGGIQGLAYGKKVNIEVLSLISNGEQLLSFGANAEPLILYNVVKFKPSTISSYDNYFTMGGVLDLNIPRFNANQTGTIKVSPNGKLPKMEIIPQQYEFEGKGFVDFKSLGIPEEPQIIEQDKLTLFATVIEPGKTPLLKCKLVKEGIDGDAKISLLPNQKVALGSNKLTNVTGKMEVKNNDWGYLFFEGDLEGFSGVNDAAKHLAFTVYGDIKAEGQALKMDNINTPFGGMEIVYDFNKNQLVGHMDINMDFSQSLAVQGVANMIFDNGGFLVSVAAQVTAPVVNTFNAGILLGTYSNIPTNFLTDVVKYNYNKNVPCYIKEKGLGGFFITGGRELPLKVPQFSINIPPGLSVVSISCGAKSGLEFQLAMNFKGGLKLDANILAFAHAWAGVGSITCTKAGADVTAELLVRGSYEAGNFFIEGCGSLVLKVEGDQSVPPFCTPPSINLGTSLGAKYIVHLGSDGFHQEFSFSMGSDANGCTAALNCK